MRRCCFSSTLQFGALSSRLRSPQLVWLRSTARFYSTKKGGLDSTDWRYNPDVNATVPYEYKSAWELKQDVWKREQRSKIIDKKLGNESKEMESNGSAVGEDGEVLVKNKREADLSDEKTLEGIKDRIQGRDNAWKHPLAELENPNLPENDGLSEHGEALPPTLYTESTTGQVIYPATEEDIEILSEAEHRYIDPHECEGSVVIRVVRLSDPVTSPVGRVVRNRQYGIRGHEKYFIVGFATMCTCLIFSFGIWQLRRMKFKKEIIEKRHERLNMPRIEVKSSPFPWNENNLADYEYRVVQVSGVYDHSKEIWVGPRPPQTPYEMKKPGYLVITPLRLADGSTVMVNRGMLPFEWLASTEKKETNEWVTVRGVLVAGELMSFKKSMMRLRNNPAARHFRYLVPDELVECVDARNHTEAGLALINAYDVRYEDDPLNARRAFRPPFDVKKRHDYMVFYCDEHVHFNYAMQWFIMGTMIFVASLFKFVEVSRWRW